MSADGLHAVVTGGSGFVGRRLVEMLIERGAAKVVSFDICPPPAGSLEDPRIIYQTGDITKGGDVDRACEGAECVFHVAALVGPFHDKEKYMAVNYNGTLNVMSACRKHSVPKIVLSSSPSTRFDGSDIDGLTEDQLPFPPRNFLQLYAESKYLAEKALREACSDELMTVAVAPHQVYGPRDPLMLPSLLSAAGSGKLRIFGNGQNRISMTYVDNYCHGLILGCNALFKDSPALGKFYIVTDGGYELFWRILDEASIHMGFQSLWGKMKLPYWFMMIVAYLFVVVGWILGRKMRVNPFTVTVLTMHRWFDISAARRDLKYEPLVNFKEGWATTLKWFEENWLPSTPWAKRPAAASKAD
jgi:nucleoside-diphosphate-sugar epimerase